MSTPTAPPPATAAGRNFVQAHGIWKRFGSTAALCGVSFALREKEILGIIGPSGSGKTTLLRCLDMLDTIDDGRLVYDGLGTVSIIARDGRLLAGGKNDGEIAASEEVITAIRKEIGLVFQSFNLWEERTVLANLVLAPMVVRGQTRSVAEEKARELCRQFGLEEKIHARGWQLSGGQKQRVAIVRALMMEPKLILLDEITSALDPVLSVEVMQAVRQLRDRGLTMVVVSHHIEFASSICDRMMFLSHGRVVQIDAPQKLKESPATDEVGRFLDILRAAR